MSLKTQVLALIKKNADKGLAVDEIAAELGEDEDSVQAVLDELEASGEVEAE